MKQGWEKKKLPDVLWFQEGPGVRKHQYVSEGIKLLNVANLVNGKLDLSTSDRYISIDEAYGKYKHFLVDEGDLILASSGIQVEYIEKKMGFVQKEHLPLCMNTSTIRFKTLNKNVLNIEYFMYFLKSYEFKRQLFSLITGCAQLNYGPSHLKQMVVPVPLIAEQEKIVAELDCLSGIIEKKKQQLKELDNLAQSIFYEMFGDPVENDKGWDIKKLGDVCDIICGQDYKSVKDDNGKYPIYGTGGIMGYASEYRCPAETVIIGRKGNINNPIYVDCEFWNVDTAFGVVPNKTVIAPMYFYFFCKNYDFTIHDVSVTIPSLRRTDIIKIDVPVPSLNIQKEFVSKIESIEKQKELIAQSIKETETLFNSRMDYYFN